MLLVGSRATLLASPARWHVTRKEQTAILAAKLTRTKVGMNYSLRAFAGSIRESFILMELD